MRALALAAGLGLVAGCTSSPKPGGPTRDRDPDPDPTPVVVEPDAKEPPVPSAPASATFTFKSHKRERPPMSTVTVDASLRNPGDRARWFLLPASAAKGQDPIATSSFGASTFALVGTGNVVLARFGGASSFYAIQLPPGAEVELRALAIKIAGELPGDPLPLEVVVADSFTVGGEAPATWTGSAATCEPRADATLAGAKQVHSHRTPDLGAVDIAVQGAERLDASVAIAK